MPNLRYREFVCVATGGTRSTQQGPLLGWGQEGSCAPCESTELSCTLDEQSRCLQCLDFVVCIPDIAH